MWITVEGGEGAGKSTQITKMADYFQSLGRPCITTREPGGTQLGEHIRNCLLNPEFGIEIGANAELMLFLAARAQHMDEVILPALAQDKVVICDRFSDSTIAYQGAGRGLGVERVERLCQLVTDGREPDLTFVFDIDPLKAFDRIHRVHDRLESLELSFHQRVRETFLQIAALNPQRVRLVDASQPPDFVFAEVLKVLNDFLTQR